MTAPTPAASDAVTRCCGRRGADVAQRSTRCCDAARRCAEPRACIASCRRSAHRHTAPADRLRACSDDGRGCLRSETSTVTPGTPQRRYLHGTALARHGTARAIVQRARRRSRSASMLTSRMPRGAWHYIMPHTTYGPRQRGVGGGKSWGRTASPGGRRRSGTSLRRSLCRRRGQPRPATREPTPGVPPSTLEYPVSTSEYLRVPCEYLRVP